MLTEVLLPMFIKVDQFNLEEKMIRLEATSAQAEIRCPVCQQPAQRRHSHYGRTVADLPWAEFRVCLELRVHRFFCDNEACQRKIFTERLSDFVAPSARRTLRLRCKQRQTALKLGGEAGANLLQALEMPTSPDTLLRVIQREAAKSVKTPRVLGVDDWAWCKGQRYGTILIDLEQHCPVELLPDRSADTLAAWLQAHPGVEIISRDRANEYIEGATRGAPKAVQVADRFHLLQNLKDALERLLDQHPACLYAAATPPEPPAEAEPKTGPQGEQASPSTLTQAEQQRQATRQRRLARYQAVLELQQQGFGQSAIARQVGLGGQTVRRYLQVGTFPEMAQRPKAPSILDPYRAYLKQRWAEGCHNGPQLYREIHPQGYHGSQSLVNQWATTQRPEDPTRSQLSRTNSTKKSKSSLQRPWSARYAVWVLLKEPEQLGADKKAALERLLKASPEVARAYNFGHAFLRIVRQRFSKALEPWLEAMAESGLPPLQSLAASLGRDKAAVLAALELPWSNGQVEGHVNRLKLIKRQMYGRANFDLLRQRVLAT